MQVDQNKARFVVKTVFKSFLFSETNNEHIYLYRIIFRCIYFILQKEGKEQNGVAVRHTSVSWSYFTQTFPKGTWNVNVDLTNKVYIVTGANVGKIQNSFFFQMFLSLLSRQHYDIQCIINIYVIIPIFIYYFMRRHRISHGKETRLHERYCSSW